MLHVIGTAPDFSFLPVKKGSSHNLALIRGFPQDFQLLHPLAEITATHLLSSTYVAVNTEKHAEPGRTFTKKHSKVLRTIYGIKVCKK